MNQLEPNERARHDCEERVKGNLQKAYRNNRTFYDNHRRAGEFQVGDKVLRRN